MKAKKSMLRILSMIAVIVLGAGHVRAGVANAVIACKSLSAKGGVISLGGNIPGDLAEFELSIKRNNTERKMASANEDDVVVVDDFDNRVFTMIVNADAGQLVLYAIPRTIYARKGRDGSLRVRFNAVLREAPNPMGGDALSDVKMTCTYEYSI